MKGRYTVPYLDITKSENFEQVITNAAISVRIIDGEVLIAIIVPSNRLLEDGLMVIASGNTDTYHGGDYEPAPAVVTVYTDDALFRNA